MFLRAFWRGALAGAPAQIATFPFGLIFGALSVQAGLDVAQTMAMTVVVIAGASQLAALQLMADDAPAWLAVATGAVVNLRMAMYSAHIAQKWPGAPLATRALAAYTLHDQSYAFSIRRYAEAPDEGLTDRFGFYFGVGLVCIAAWLAGCLTGALFGARLPQEWALEFAVPITFIAVFAPMLRTAPQAISAMASAGGALAFAFLPLGLGLMAAAALGIAAGLLAERALAR